MSRAIEEFNKTSNKSEDENGSSQRRGANQAKKRSVLGRGLSALMSPTTTIDLGQNSNKSQENQAQKPFYQNPPTPQTAKTEVTEKAKNTGPYQNLPIDQLVPNPNQPRTNFDQKEIRELASSIRKSGLIQPILVRKKTNSNSSFSTYEIIAGERRWRASKEAGLITVPAIVKELNDHETLEISIIENIQRQDLSPIEEARAYNRLINEFGSTQEEIAKNLGKDRSSIANTIRLLNLSEKIQELINQKQITAGHARAILSLENPAEQEELALLLSSEKISVREAEKLASEKKAKSKVTNTSSSLNTPPTNPSNNALEERLRRALGTKVKVNISASGKGEVKISFFSRSEFEDFLEKVKA